MLEIANLLFLSKEVTEKDYSLEAQLLVSSSKSDEKDAGERVWQEQGCFGNERGKLNISEIDFLIYPNLLQSGLSSNN